MAVLMGVVGTGGLGYLQSTVYAEMDDVSIVAGADVSPDSRETYEMEFEVPTYQDYRDLLAAHDDELDAVTIATPHTLHHEQVMATLTHDVDVHVEKPMVTDVADAVEIVETSANRDCIVQVGYQRHFHPGFREVRRVVDTGRIGTLHAVNCHLGQDWIDLHRNTWRADPSLAGGGQLYDTGSHLIDALLWTLDVTPATVAAEMEFAEPGVDVNSVLSIRFDSNGDQVVGGVVVSGDGVDIEPSEGYFYWGTEGRLAYVDNHITVAEKGAATYSTEITEGIDYRTLTRRKLRRFVEAVQGHAEPAVPAEFGLRVTALTEAAYWAAETGSRVNVAELVADHRE